MGLDVFQLARRSHGKILEVQIDLLSLRIPQSQVETGLEREVGQEAGSTAIAVGENSGDPA